MTSRTNAPMYAPLVVLEDAFHESAVDLDVRPGDVTRRIRRQKRNQAGQLAWLAQTTERNLPDDSPLYFRRSDSFARRTGFGDFDHPLGPGKSRRNRIDEDPVGRDF